MASHSLSTGQGNVVTANGQAREPAPGPYARSERPKIESTVPITATSVASASHAAKKPASVSSLLLSATVVSGALPAQLDSHSSQTTSLPQIDPSMIISENKSVSMTEKDLQAVAVIYGALKNLRGPVDSAQDAKITAAFDAHVQQTMAELSLKLDGITDGNHRQVEIALSKLRLFDVCHTEAEAVAATMSSDLSALLATVRSISKPILSAISRLTSDMCAQHATALSSAKQFATQAEFDAQQVFTAAKGVEDQLKEAQSENKRLSALLKSHEEERKRWNDEQAQQTKRFNEMESEVQRLKTTVQSLQQKATSEKTSTRHTMRKDALDNEKAPDTARTEVSTTTMASKKSVHAPSVNAPSVAPSAVTAQSGDTVDVSSKIRQLLFGTTAAAALQGSNASSNAKPSKSDKVQALLTALSKPSTVVSGATAPTAASKQKESVSPIRQRASSLEPRQKAATPPTASPNTASYAPRALSLRQLHDFIDALFASKSRYDAKCYAQHLPRETLEQHLYTYLNQKFGLKQLIVDHAAAVINTAAALAPYDNDAAVFSKMLRNDIDEDFRLIQLQLKETARDLLRAQLKDQHVGANPATITTVLAQRIGAYYAGVPEGAGPHPSDAIGVHQAEWQNIVRYMYSATDADILFRRLNDVVLRRTLADAFHLTPAISTVTVRATQLPAVVSLSPGGAHSPTTASSAGASSGPVSPVAVDVALASDQRVAAMIASFPAAELTRIVDMHNPTRKIAWPSFLHVLLQFQLEGHDRFLSKFRHIFKEIDVDSTGILSQDAFRRLVTTVSPMKTEAEVGALVNAVDPYGHSKITFSDCVAVISADLAAQLKKPNMQSVVLQQQQQHLLLNNGPSQAVTHHEPHNVPATAAVTTGSDISHVGSTKRTLTFTPNVSGRAVGSGVPSKGTATAALDSTKFSGAHTKVNATLETKPYPLPVPLSRAVINNKQLSHAQAQPVRSVSPPPAPVAPKVRSVSPGPAPVASRASSIKARPAAGRYSTGAAASKTAAGARINRSASVPKGR